MDLHKLEIAKRQIEVATSLYFSNADFLAVITLAGAAEEILGNLLQRKGEYRVLDHLVELDKSITGGRNFKEISEEVNHVRNALKHAREAKEDVISVDPGEAIAMLSRAVVNYVLLTNDASPSIVRIYKHLVDLHPDVIR